MRVHDWAERLNALVLDRLAMPFAWGHNDCVSFVADALQAQHGNDVLAESRTVRNTGLQAARQLRRGGGLPVALERAGLAPVAPALAAVGDVVWLQQGRHRVLALCNGADALSPGRHGLVCNPMRHAVAAWRA